ncbi:hypothetical protein PF005_g23288 [Phytophthora fragariae]|uniref:Uncharacterized protein n=1 Tax=Phytophthora fragariae TaxID=53985 RepID=A0A6A3DXC1_9STRA|nr:hypothetical protein PF009_g24033 [Phytophthora fragariae]KAE8974394.1 hypothetical protein PF011_g24881 [Phytophthora fragariae]KAE9081748.1 hypothetical protein PF007_g22541 [Phytophthora fragariae]KAE9103434.1 hypothetical protein PF006_g22179 [Phytophthora fragariae]KAE9180403.1 hypothetical protein PF005_g23288 [Phytophthora fragariae]
MDVGSPVTVTGCSVVDVVPTDTCAAPRTASGVLVAAGSPTELTGVSTRVEEAREGAEMLAPAEVGVSLCETEDAGAAGVSC